jgi:hypothetical protein
MAARLARLPLFAIWRREFAGYNRSILRRDVLAGITVGAVVLPLALAFGVASGADAAAGLVTAVLAGLIIGGLGGAAYQISGPTGAMAAVLIILAQRYGLGAEKRSFVMGECPSASPFQTVPQVSPPGSASYPTRSASGTLVYGSVVPGRWYQ